MASEPLDTRHEMSIILGESSGFRSTNARFSYGAGNNARVLSPSAGVNTINWSYQLKTVATPTYGGEVIQILGASITPVTITGFARTAQEYEQVRDWFVKAMRYYGSGTRRHEMPILFEYPERGWSLYVMPINFGPWEISNENMAGAGSEWSVTAEVVSHETNALVQYSMDQHENFGIPDSSLLAPHAFDYWRNTFDPAINPDGFYTDDQLEDLGNKLDNTLAQLVAGAFDLFGRADSEKSADDTYKDIFGSKWLTGGDSTVLSGTGFNGEPSTRLETVAAIVSAFEAAGVPGRIGVATALHESNLEPDAWNGDYMGLFQTNHLGRGASSPNKAHIKAAYDAAKAVSPDPGSTNVPAIVQNYPASEQIADAARWFPDYAPDNTSSISRDQALAWAERAQGAPGQFISWPRVWNEAATLIEQAAQVATVTGDWSTPKTVIDTIVVPIATKHGLKAANGQPASAASIAAANATHGSTKSGNRSDHQGPPKEAWAADLSDGDGKSGDDKSSWSATKEGAAVDLARAFRVPWTPATGGLKESKINGYRIQLIYKNYSGHENHVHIGVRKL